MGSCIRPVQQKTFIGEKLPRYCHFQLHSIKKMPAPLETNTWKTNDRTSFDSMYLDMEKEENTSCEIHTLYHLYRVDPQRSVSASISKSDLMSPRLDVLSSSHP